MTMPIGSSQSEATRDVTAFLAAVDASDGTGDPVATAAAASLVTITATSLPAPAQPVWRDLTRLLKASSDEPLPLRAIEAMRSWPKTRITQLIDLTRKLQSILQQHDNDRWEDEIRDKLRHNYL
ncbi:MAG: hypothetical protein R3D67_07400 [Hyphomicrobiaceae bacterium]